MRIGVGRALLPASPLHRSQFQHGFDHMLGLGPRNKDGRRDDEIHAPEFLMARDVLRGHAARAFGERSFVAGLLVCREFALGMRK